MGASVTCPRCGLTSHNPNDVDEGYCGNCHWWTSRRAEHLAWSKRRALEVLEAGDVAGAVASMLSDLAKHEQLARSSKHLQALGVIAAAAGDAHEARRFIEGFN